MAVLPEWRLQMMERYFGVMQKLLRKIFYRLMLDFALLQHLQELIKEIAGTGSQSFFREICQQKIAHGKESTLQERLHNLTAIWFP